jgi:hypothetical protein
MLLAKTAAMAVAKNKLKIQVIRYLLPWGRIDRGYQAGYWWAGTPLERHRDGTHGLEDNLTVKLQGWLFAVSA